MSFAISLIMGDEGKGIQCVISKEVKSIIALKNYFPVSVEDDSYLNKFVNNHFRLF